MPKIYWIQERYQRSQCITPGGLFIFYVSLTLTVIVCIIFNFLFNFKTLKHK